MNAVKRYLWNNLVALDIACNTIFGGDPRQTISARVYVYRNDNRVAGLVYRFLDWLQPGHCEMAYQADRAGTDGSQAVLK